jgi:UTP--glucose-1-phosphate uridylyltransferase
MDKFEDKMRSDGLNDAAVAAFKHNYEQLVAGVDGIVPEGSIEAIEVRFQRIST